MRKHQSLCQQDSSQELLSEPLQQAEHRYPFDAVASRLPTQPADRSTRTSSEQQTQSVPHAEVARGCFPKVASAWLRTSDLGEARWDLRKPLVAKYSNGSLTFEQIDQKPVD